jgi:hypothetical protein
VVLAALWGLLGGCREQSSAPIDRNKPPETFLTSAPGDSQTTFYWVSMRWGGTDIDGAIDGFDVAVTESLPNVETIEWKRTRRSDSLITFPVEETREVLGHRFYVRAVDNEGKVDETPAWVFFGVRDNVAPTIHFKTAEAFGPNGETMELLSTDPEAPTDTIPTGWGVRFNWDGTDGDVAYGSDGAIVHVGRVTQFLYRLLPVESQFLGGGLADTSALYNPDYFSRFPRGNVYAFNTRAVDDAGLSGSGSVTRSFVWNRDPVTKFTRCARNGSSDSVRCFVEAQTTYFEGDTLPLPRGASDPFPSPVFRARGYDPDPVGTTSHAVKTLEWRYTTGVVLPQWTEFAADEGLRMEGLRSADYLVMARSTDGLERVEGTPDTIRFYINFTPRFFTRVDSTGFQQFPMPDDRIRLSEIGDTLKVRFYLYDPDQGFSEKIKVSYRFDSENEAFFRGGKLRLSGRVSSIGVVPEGGHFVAKRYVLRLSAEDNGQQGGSDRGVARSKIRIIPFTVVEG